MSDIPDDVQKLAENYARRMANALLGTGAVPLVSILADAIMADRRSRDTASEGMAKALEPFAHIAPSTLYAPDGSNGEGYRATLVDDLDPGMDFSGRDLATARAALAAYTGKDGE